jgi:hypothetical protein
MAQLVTKADGGVQDFAGKEIGCADEVTSFVYVGSSNDRNWKL